MRRALPFLFLLASLALCFAVYYPGLSGAFMFDDTINIGANDSLQITRLDFTQLKKAALSGTAGIFGRPVSTLSFALDYYHSGYSAPAFKLTNLLIHMLNGILVFCFARLLLQAHRGGEDRILTERDATWIAIALASIWLVHPLNLTSVLYVVQRMTSLSTLFTLLGLISYLYGRLAMKQGNSAPAWTAIVASFLLFTPLAALCKENGALLPLFLLLTEVFFLHFQAPTARARQVLVLGFGLSVALPMAALATYTLYNPAWITAAYKMRLFTLGERLLTEPRVLWMYIRLAFAPDMSLLGLHHDDILVSTSLFSPPMTFFAAAGLVALLAIAVFSYRRHRILSFSIALFLVGHAMESSVLALELAHEHRNYFPLIGLLLAPAYYLFLPSIRARMGGARPMLVVGVVALLATITLLRATQWGDHVRMMQKEVAHHPDSSRANVALANFYAATPGTSREESERLYGGAYEHYAKISQLSPADTLGLFGLISLNLNAHLPIDDTWIPALTARIEKYPMSASTVNSLINLEMCVEAKTCKLTAGMTETLLAAGLRNPTLQASAHSQILFAWSSLMFEAKGDKAAASAAAYQAARLAPQDLDAQLNLIVLLSNMHNDSEARAQIAALRLLDRMHVKTEKLAEIDAILDKRQKSAP